MTIRCLRGLSSTFAALLVLVCPTVGTAQTVTSNGAPTGFVEPAPLVRVGPPNGWEFAFDDGRLNPNRGKRTARGDAQSSQLWTDTVPRRAIPLPPGTVIETRNIGH